MNSNSTKNKAPTLWPYLKTKGVKSEGVRWYAVFYLAAIVFLFVFWWSWFTAPTPGVKPGFEVAPFDMDGLEFEGTPDLYGLEFTFMTITPTP